jgi:hypothetical protein
LNLIECRQLTNKKKETIQGAKFFTVSADEVTTIDNETWISVTMYYVSDFARESMNVALEHIDEGATSNNLMKVIMKAIQWLTSMSREEIASKMMAFGVGKWARESLLFCVA